MEEESEKRDYFNAFLKTVETDLKHNKLAYVFNKEQLDAIKKKFNIRIVREDDTCIYIKLKKEGA